MGSVGNENLGIVSPKVNFIAENDFVNNSNISGLTLIHWLDCRLFFPFLTSTNPNCSVLKLLFVRYTKKSSLGSDSCKVRGELEILCRVLNMRMR